MASNHHIIKYNQWLAGQVSVRFIFDLVEEAKPVETILSFIIPRKLIFEDGNWAILEAKAKIANLNLWCDKSKFENQGTGAAVVLEKDGIKKEWYEQKFRLDFNKEIFNAKMWGISKAFKVAGQKSRQIQRLWTVNIFCDL